MCGQTPCLCEHLGYEKDPTRMDWRRVPLGSRLFSEEWESTYIDEGPVNDSEAATVAPGGRVVFTSERGRREYEKALRPTIRMPPTMLGDGYRFESRQVSMRAAEHVDIGAPVVLEGPEGVRAARAGDSPFGVALEAGERGELVRVAIG